MFTLRACFADGRSGGWAGTRAVPDGTEPVNGSYGVLVVWDSPLRALSSTLGAFGRWVAGCTSGSPRRAGWSSLRRLLSLAGLIRPGGEIGDGRLV